MMMIMIMMIMIMMIMMMIMIIIMMMMMIIIGADFVILLSRLQALTSPPSATPPFVACLQYLAT
jgi:hypothetical protein